MSLFFEMTTAFLGAAFVYPIRLTRMKAVESWASEKRKDVERSRNRIDRIMEEALVKCNDLTGMIFRGYISKRYRGVFCRVIYIVFG